MRRQQNTSFAWLFMERLEERLVPALTAGDILVVDQLASPQAIFRIDPTTGGQTRLVSSGLPGRSEGIAVPPNHDIFVVGDMPGQNIGQVVKIDGQTGQTRLLASGGPLVWPRNAIVDELGRLWVVDAAAFGGPGAVFLVDRSSGAVTTVSTGGYFAEPVGIAPAPEGDVYVADAAVLDGTGGVFRISARTGIQTIIASGFPFEDPRDIVVEPSGTLLITDSGGDGSVIRVDPRNRSKQVMAINTGGTGFFGVAMQSKDFALVVDPDAQRGAGSLFRFNVRTGSKSLLSTGGLFVDPIDVAVVPGRSLQTSS